jgi:hypothetical protein
MEEPQPNNLPPTAGIPQIPPQRLAGKRYIYLPPTFRPLSTPPHGPILQQNTQNRFVETAPSITQPPGYQHSPIPRQVTQRLDGHIAPAIRLPAKPQKPPAGQQAPQKPGLLSFANATVQRSPITATQHELPITPPQMRIPVTPPCSIPGYYTTRYKSQEPRMGETLLGCAMLLLVGIIVLIILYYLAM